MERLHQLLQTGRNGHAVLFCGAGLTADCLNFVNDETIGVTVELLRLLNEELKKDGKVHGFGDIRNAAKQFRRDLGNNRLMHLLKNRFHLKDVSASIIDVVKYPWATIYTTNFDNGIEIALQRSKIRYSSLNNLDDPNEPYAGTAVIHLHGSADAWTVQTFEQSCILDITSYRDLSGLKSWLDRLRYDIERASIVVFIGFSAADFHLGQVFFNATGLREKAFFINRPVSHPNVDEHATQEEFGVPLYIGREDFSNIVAQVIHRDAPHEPSLASFCRFITPPPSSAVPPVQDIENLLIWGDVNIEHVRRDFLYHKSDDHVVRSEVKLVVDHLAQNGGVVLVNGDICDGKTLIILGVVCALSASRPVFQLRHPYTDLLDEASSILAAYPKCLLVVENCFSIHGDRLVALARLVAASEAGLILSARSISTEAESYKLRGLRAISNFRELSIGRLSDSEADALVSLIDQIAGWRSFKALSRGDRLKFVCGECNGVVPSVLLKLLESEYVREKYKEEFAKTSYLDSNERSMIIASLLTANVGYDAPSSLISELFEGDFSTVLKRVSKQHSGLKLVKISANGTVSTVPSIGARNLLRHIVEDREIVDANIRILESLSDRARRSDVERHIFSQLMRYSILNSIVNGVSEINRFFDHISKISHFRAMPLFWLQWHLAMCSQERWLDAEKYLEMGYTAADAYDKHREEIFNRKQLNDRKAKFLASRARSRQRCGDELLRDMREAIRIVGILMKDTEIAYHPFETLLEIAKTVQELGVTVEFHQRTVLEQGLRTLASLAKRRLDAVPAGYQRRHASNALDQISPMFEDSSS